MTTLLDGYRDRLELFRQSDEERNHLLRDLLYNVDKLEEKLAEQKREHENEVQSRRMWQRQHGDMESQLKYLSRSIEANSFVCVYVDGDGALFKDELVAQGETGGAAAAHQLQSEIKEHLYTKFPDSPVDSWNIMINVILSMEALAFRLHVARIIDAPERLREFANGFGQYNQLFSFIDVGRGKERADTKIREMLRVHAPLIQCKQVIFGPCNDNGYRPFLEQYNHDPNNKNKFTLLEPIPAQAGFEGLTFDRLTQPKLNVFRSELLSNGPPHRIGMRPSVPAVTTRTGPPAGSPAQSISSIEVRDSVNTSWASTARPDSASDNWQDVKPAKKTKSASSAFYAVNKDSERVDEPVYPGPGARARVEERSNVNGRRFCNIYHITGECNKGDACAYMHGPRLEAPERAYLQMISRANRCNYGRACDNARCVNGHHCKFGSSCTNAKCKFIDTHSMDTTPAMRFYEDGHTEALTVT